MTTDRKATPERARKAPKAPARSGELGKVLPVVRRREKPRKRGGRPSIIEPAVVEAIVRTVRLGNYRDTAAVYAGIGKRTLYTWLARGRAERERVDREGGKVSELELPYVELLSAIEHDEAEAVTFAAARYRQLMESEDETVAERAVRNFLERKDPAGWARIDRHEVMVGGDPGRPLEVSLTIKEQRDRVAAILTELVAANAIDAAIVDVAALPSPEEKSRKRKGAA